MEKRVNEKPILFSSSMIRAILNGSKTQTRRVVKVDFDISELATPMMWAEALAGNYSARPSPQQIEEKARQLEGRLHAVIKDDGSMVGIRCPYGQPGDRLWVREAYADIGFRLTYRADEDDGAHCKVKKWTPSIHMFREDSRILLEITDVRVERLQDISEVDAIAEGCHSDAGLRGDDDIAVDQIMRMHDHAAGRIGAIPAPVARFVLLWDSINGANAGVTNWNANPWVWVVSFKRVTP